MIDAFASVLTAYFDFLWMSFLLLAPMLMLGLLLSGLIHVFVSRDAILRWLRDDSLRSVSISSAIGVPIPLCSCSVVPVVAEMRRKGASRSSCMAFLITAPETGADSILVTNAFFGFVASVVRPVISFITAVIAGICCIGMVREDSDKKETGACGNDRSGQSDLQDCCNRTQSETGCDPAGHTTLVPGRDDCYVSPSTVKVLMMRWIGEMTSVVAGRKFRTWFRSGSYRGAADNHRTDPDSKTSLDAAEGDAPRLDFKKIVRHIMHYGFVEIADDVLCALLVGILLGGVLFLVIPADLMATEYARWISYPVMVIVGLPLYICASASTPIAAAMVAKGVSPGAALIFLMTGPATNTSTITVIMNRFGARFATVYVVSVIVVTTALGIALDFLLLATGFTLSVNLLPSESHTLQLLQWGGAIALIGLIIWRYRAGAIHRGYAELLANIRPLLQLSRYTRRRYNRG